MKETFSLMLPYPPSANRYWRLAGKNLVVSDEAKRFKREVFMLGKVGQVQKVVHGPVAVHVDFYPVKKRGKRLDLDNCLKVTMDSLQGVAYMNDSQVEEILARVMEPVDGGGVRVTWGVKG